MDVSSTTQLFGAMTTMRVSSNLLDTNIIKTTNTDLPTKLEVKSKLKSDFKETKAKLEKTSPKLTK